MLHEIEMDHKIIASISFCFLGIILTGICTAQKDESLKLWYTQPAKSWEQEALPIGNGRMGAMLFGGINQEKIQFNEQSLWSGDNNWDGEYECGDHGFGSYRNFGEFTIDFKFSGEPSEYIRSLDITNGIHTTSFVIDGVHYKREAFASHPDQVMVFHYKCSKKGHLSGKILLVSAQDAKSTASKTGLGFTGEMPNKLKYAALVKVLHKGGKTTKKGNILEFENCNSLTLLVDARTNYKPDFKSGWR